MEMREIINIITEILNERSERVEIKNKSFILLQDPTADQLLMMLKRSAHLTLRGLILEQSIYWWDADFATHGAVASYLLGVEKYWEAPPYDNEGRMYMEMDRDEPTIQCQSEYLDFPKLVNILKSDKILF